MHINGTSLRAIRERSGWTVTGLAAESDIGRSHLSNVEAGRRQLSPAAALRVAEVLNVPLAAITSTYTPEQVQGISA